MEEKKNSALADVMADIAVTPIAIAEMAVKAKRKIEETPTKTGTIGSDVKEFSEKAAERVQERAQKLQDSEVGQRIKSRVQDSEVRQKIKDKVDEISTSEGSAKVQEVFDYAGNKVKNLAYQIHDDMTENVIKAKNDIDNFKAQRKSAKEAGADIEETLKQDEEFVREAVTKTVNKAEETLSDAEEAIADKPKDATDILMDSVNDFK